MKVFFVFAVLCIAVVAAKPMDACNKYGCASVGQSCVNTNTTTMQCIGGTYCNNGTVCTNYPSIGQPCYGNKCATGAVCGNATTCVASGKANGASCTVFGECTSGICTNGVCVGINIGGACSADKNCIGDLVFCDTQGSGLCTAAVAVNGACNLLLPATSNVCAGPYACIANSTTLSASVGVCRTPYQGAVGTPCRRPKECADGLYCAGANGTSLGSCATAPALIGGLCDVPANCSGNYGCYCDTNLGTEKCVSTIYGSPSGSKSAATSLVSCVAKKCSTLSTVCVSNSCGFESCTAANLLLSTSRALPGSGPSCLVNDRFPLAVCKKDASTSSASIVAASASVAVVAALAALL